ncbi:MAG TPA: type IV pilus modification protein PilV [Casimicrobiaceae bacterium]|jgi:type IV pilus assembly protein PilV
MSHRPTLQARTVSSPRAQAGAYLLEALIAILIFSFGVLGIVGLQAQALRFTNDSEYRAEAVYLANSLISQMWVDSYNAIPANYASPGGPKFATFKTNVSNTFKAAMVQDPVVLVDPPAPMPQAPTKTSRVVQVQIFWRLPGEPLTILHNYTTTGVVGMN